MTRLILILAAFFTLPVFAEETRDGEASYYSNSLQGKETATGERFDQRKNTAASPDLPLGSKATITNKENGKSVVVEITDRGPYKDGRVIDLSKNAAKEIGITSGTAPVTVDPKQ
jgi:rare lipoprotein A